VDRAFLKIHRRGAYAVGWLFLYLLLTHGALPGLVLCLGVNGHIAVETPHNIPSYPTSQEEGPCLDLPLISASRDDLPLMSSLQQTSQRLEPLAGAALVPFMVLGNLLPHRRRFTSTPLTTPQATFLRIGVLRI
jgi:hypothetical protein